MANLINEFMIMNKEVFLGYKNRLVVAFFDFRVFFCNYIFFQSKNVNFFVRTLLLLKNVL